MTLVIWDIDGFSIILFWTSEEKKNQEKSESDTSAMNEQDHHWPSKIMDFLLRWGFILSYETNCKGW